VEDQTSHGPVVRLEGYLTQQEAADVLGTSRQNVSKMCAAGTFKDLREVGSRVVILIPTAEVQRVAEERTAKQQLRQDAKDARDAAAD
jgi:hypothetical protein